MDYESTEEYMQEFNAANAGKVYYFMLMSGVEVLAVMESITPGGFICTYPLLLREVDGVPTIRNMSQYTDNYVIVLDTEKLLYYGHALDSVVIAYNNSVKALYGIDRGMATPTKKRKVWGKTDEEIQEKISKNPLHFVRGDDTIN